jgi:glycosyltransferase involved in cell wall biosynthesis
VHSTRYLTETLESIFKSEKNPGTWELIVVLDRVARDDFRAQVPPKPNDIHLKILESRNPGIVNSLNLGLKNCKSKYVARIDEDDLVHPLRFVSQLRFLKISQNVIVVGSAMKIIDAQGCTVGMKYFPCSDKKIRRQFLRTSPIAHPASMYLLEPVLKINGYRQGVPEDWDLWMRLSQIGQLANLTFPLISYRQHPEQLSRQDFYKLKVARRRLVIGSFAAESELLELDHFKLANTKSITEVSTKVFSQINKKTLKSINRIEKFENSYKNLRFYHKIQVRQP